MVPPWSTRERATLRASAAVVFSKRAVLRAAVRAEHARWDSCVRSRRRKPRPVAGRGDAEGPREARGKGADAPQPDGEADLGDRSVGRAQQRSRALEAARQQVRMRRLAERPAELAAEMRTRQSGRRRKIIDV